MRRLALPSIATLLLSATTAHADVTTARPRIYLTPDRLPALRAELPTDPDFVLMEEWMGRRIENQDAEPMLTGTYPNIVMTEAAFVATMLPDSPQYTTEARIYLAALAAIEADAENAITATRNRTLALAIGYDWLHDALPPGEAAAARAAIIAHTTSLAELIDDANYVSGPSRWANVVALAGAIAVAGEDASLDATLDVVLANWRDGYNPVLEAAGADGGHHMAWMYGPAYSGFEAPLMWRTASDEDEPWVEDFLADAAYFPIYAANGAYQVPPIEDCFGNTIATGALAQISLSSGLFGNAHAESFYRELDDAFDDPPLLQPPDLWLRLVTRQGAPRPAPIDELPLSRMFSGAGFHVVRDDWSRDDATTIVFKASPFYSIGHHQRDEGALYIDHRGPLLVDAGQYDGSGSDPHYRNFYSRSVAHNTLLVHWADEDVPLSGFVHDGGQQVRVGQAQDAAQMAGDFALDGIVGHSDAGACTWARSDTADAYDSLKLTTYTRDVLTMRRPGGAPHPALFVVDQATLPELRPSSVLWHFAANAEIDAAAHRITAEGADQTALHPSLSGGRIVLDLLRPAAPQIDTFTGDDRWTTDSGAFPPMPQEDLLSPYWGRVEVTTQELAPVWSTLIRIGNEVLVDETSAPLDLGGDDWIGARSGDTLFAIAQPSTTMLALPDGAPLVDGCIAGLAPGASVDVVVGAGEIVTLQANADGVAVYDPTAGGDTGTSSGADGGSGDGSASATGDMTGGPATTNPTSSSADADTTGAGLDDASSGGCGCATRGGALGSAWPFVVLVACRRAERRRRRPTH